MPQVPPSGYRIPLSVPGTPFPGVERTREAPFTDLDGKSRVFIGSALLEYSVHPCKITPDREHPCQLSYGGSEIAHTGRYDLLPFVPEHMEFVKTSHGRVPFGRRPVKGGFENDGSELYHAVAVIDGVNVPGKTGIHLVRPSGIFVAIVSMWKAGPHVSYQGGANVPYGGSEHAVNDDYEILLRCIHPPSLAIAHSWRAGAGNSRLAVLTTAWQAQLL